MTFILALGINSKKRIGVDITCSGYKPLFLQSLFCVSHGGQGKEAGSAMRG